MSMDLLTPVEIDELKDLAAWGMKRGVAMLRIPPEQIAKLIAAHGRCEMLEKMLTDMRSRMTRTAYLELSDVAYLSPYEAHVGRRVRIHAVSHNGPSFFKTGASIEEAVAALSGTTP